MQPTSFTRMIFAATIALVVFSVFYFCFYLAANAGWFAHIDWLDRLAGP